jgi:hypothetical protein
LGYHRPWQVHKRGGVGVEALTLLSPAVPGGASDEPWQNLDRPSVQMLLDWVQVSKPHEYQDRFFIAGFLFGTKALLANLRLLCGRPELFGAGCGAFVDVNCLEPLQFSLNHEVAYCVLRFTAPREPSSCKAWLKLIRKVLDGWSEATQVAGECRKAWHLADREGWEVARGIREGIGCPGWPAWSAVLHVAISVLAIIPSDKLAAELAELSSLRNE